MMKECHQDVSDWLGQLFDLFAQPRETQRSLCELQAATYHPLAL